MASGATARGALLQLPGSCSCGAVRFVASVSPTSPWLYCDCTDCRRAHAADAALLVQTPNGAAGVRWGLQGSTLKFGPALTCRGLGASFRRGFCTACGSTVTVVRTGGDGDGGAGISYVAAGALDDAHFPTSFRPRFVATPGTGAGGLLAITPPSVEHRRPDAAALVSTGSGKTARAFSGSCACRGCLFNAKGPTLRLRRCHCSICRKSSGAAFITWISVQRDALTWKTSQTLRHTIRGPSGCRRSMCLRCGSMLSLQIHDERDVVWIAHNLFDDPDVLPSGQGVHVFVDSAPLWHPPQQWPPDGFLQASHLREDEPPTCAASSAPTDAVESHSMASGWDEAELLEAMRRSAEEISSSNAEEAMDDAAASSAAASSASSSAAAASSATTRILNSEWDDEEIKEALRRSVESQASAAAKSTWDQSELQEAIRQSMEVVATPQRRRVDAQEENHPEVETQIKQREMMPRCDDVSRTQGVDAGTISIAGSLKRARVPGADNDDEFGRCAWSVRLKSSRVPISLSESDVDEELEDGEAHMLEF